MFSTGIRFWAPWEACQWSRGASSGSKAACRRSRAACRGGKSILSNKRFRRAIEGLSRPSPQGHCHQDQQAMDNERIDEFKEQLLPITFTPLTGFPQLNRGSLKRRTVIYTHHVNRLHNYLARSCDWKRLVGIFATESWPQSRALWSAGRQH